MRQAETVTFGGGGLVRAAELRGDRDALARLCAQADARCLAVWRGKLPVTGETGDRLLFLHPSDKALETANEPPAFLGLEAGRPVFAADISGWEPGGDLSQLGNFLDLSEQTHPQMPEGSRFAELRLIMARLSPLEAEIAATARGLFAWHGTHGHCARCGAATRVDQAGWQRRCDACGALHFPRTDPVVIMHVTDGNRVLVGRSPGWPEGMYSLLAGFMEPGETIEAAVRREVFEETGVGIGRVTYLASQPWPFPSSLMIGCRAEALSTDITIDPKEIEDAKWLSREEIIDHWARRDGTMIAARKGAIAHFLIKNWLSDTLS